MTTTQYKPIYPHTRIDFEAEDYVVIAIAKDDRSERKVCTGSFEECEAYAERNESSDNFECYEVRR